MGFLLVEQMQVMSIEEPNLKLRALSSPRHLLSLKERFDRRLKVGSLSNSPRGEYKRVNQRNSIVPGGL
jgi:hypothetical protein